MSRTVADPGDAPREAKCDGCCKRTGTLRINDLMPAMHHLGVHEPWVFRVYYCQWCEASHTRRHNRIFGKPVTTGTFNRT